MSSSSILSYNTILNLSSFGVLGVALFFIGMASNSFTQAAASCKQKNMPCAGNIVTGVLHLAAAGVLAYVFISLQLKLFS